MLKKYLIVFSQNVLSFKQFNPPPIPSDAIVSSPDKMHPLQKLPNYMLRGLARFLFPPIFSREISHFMGPGGGGGGREAGGKGLARLPLGGEERLFHSIPLPPKTHLTYLVDCFSEENRWYFFISRIYLMLSPSASSSSVRCTFWKEVGIEYSPP